MKRWFVDLKLGRKISSLVLLTNATTLLLLTGAFAAFTHLESRRSLASELLSVTEAIASNTTAALSFGDHLTAQENVEALRADPRILAAAVFTDSGELFASYTAPGGSLPVGAADLPQGIAFTGGGALLSRNVVLDNQVLGRIVLRADLSQIRDTLWRLAILAPVVLVVSLAFGFLLSRHLVRIVTRPVLALARAAREFSSGATSTFLKPEGKDEVGEMTVCFNAMMASISERDRELREHREHLEEQVRARTAELEAARAKAEEAARLKSEFLANMSHEMRTPMNGVIGLTSLAMETELPTAAREYLELVSFSAANLLHVINDVLDFSKIEARKVLLESVPFDLRASVETLVRSLALPAHRKGIEVVCDIDPATPGQLCGDPMRLTQVITNLLGNAVKFTAAGRIAVSVRVLETDLDQEAARIEFAVSDTGIGIAADQHASIFEAFTQADGTTTRRYGGTGLGLAISSRIVELMGGSIAIESEVGRGSTFRFALLLGLTGMPGPPAQPADLIGKRVRIAESDAAARGVLVSYCRALGMVPADEGPFDLILTDSPVAEPDGPLIRLMRMDHRAGSERETDGHPVLHKPAAFRELRDVALRALGQEKQETETPAAQAKAESPLRILVAEDNRVNQIVLVRMLEARGHTVTVAGNGRDAVKAALRGGFDVILMDCQMPEMDGFEATRRIRKAEPAWERIPIVALTAYAMSGDRERCEKAGMDYYLPKPVDRERLLELLAKVPASSAEPQFCD